MNIMLISYPHLPVCRNLMYIAYKYLKKNKYNVITLGPEPVDGNINKSDNKILKSTEKSGMSFCGVLKIPICLIKTIFLIKQNNPDIVHFLHKHIWNYPIIYFCKIFFKNIKIVHSIHDPIGHEGDRVQSGVRLYNRKIIKLVDGVIVHSKNAYNQLMNNYMVNCRVKIVYFSNTELLPFREKELTKELLFFGRINKYKGCDMLPKLSDELLKMDSDIQIKVVGKASDDLEEELIGKINKCKNIKWDNRFFDNSEIDSIFESVSLVLIMYKHISQSGVISDACNHSTPVIAFDIDGIREFVNENTACLVNAFDIKEYAYGIVELLNNKETWRKMCKDAYEMGEKMYSAQGMANGFAEFYIDLLK